MNKIEAPAGSTAAQLELYDSQIKEIFKLENLPAILAVMNHILPKDLTRVAPTEYETIVKAAKYDGCVDMINNLIKYIHGK